MERGSGDNKLLDNEWHGYIYISSALPFFSLITAFVGCLFVFIFFDSDKDVRILLYINKKESIISSIRVNVLCH